MDARLIPVVLPTAKKVVQLERFKEEFKRVTEILSNEYPPENENEDYHLRYRMKTMNRYLERLTENINKLEKELGYENTNSGSV